MFTWSKSRCSMHPQAGTPWAPLAGHTALSTFRVSRIIHDPSTACSGGERSTRDLHFRYYNDSKPHTIILLLRAELLLSHKSSSRYFNFILFKVKQSTPSVINSSCRCQQKSESNECFKINTKNRHDITRPKFCYERQVCTTITCVICKEQMKYEFTELQMSMQSYVPTLLMKIISNLTFDMI